MEKQIIKLWLKRKWKVKQKTLPAVVWPYSNPQDTFISYQKHRAKAAKNSSMRLTTTQNTVSENTTAPSISPTNHNSCFTSGGNSHPAPSWTSPTCNWSTEQSPVARPNRAPLRSMFTQNTLKNHSLIWSIWPSVSPYTCSKSVCWPTKSCSINFLQFPSISSIPDWTLKENSKFG